MCYNALAEEWAEAVYRKLTFTCNIFWEIGRKKYITNRVEQGIEQKKMG